MINRKPYIFQETDLEERTAEVAEQANAIKPNLSNRLIALIGNGMELKASHHPKATNEHDKRLAEALTQPENVSLRSNGNLEVKFSGPLESKPEFHSFLLNGDLANVHQLGLPDDETQILLADAEIKASISSVNHVPASGTNLKRYEEQARTRIQDIMDKLG